ncbi:uncharacterized protein LOC131853370 isoform X2 [Achroia grisella]|uniref:uncharacterized protein LOC131853370 isoform X2 n=1 Tax=Achroia grisella TaxID=688607 RepID=UPI0027D2821C|nr:uncharacterized protein LOC131853370 isoform X2 [Achroia grisella]
MGTLRLDEVDRCVAGKKKTQKIKNLRTVCNKILDFCDRQDADDIFYEQMAAEHNNVPAQHKIENKLKKNKPTRIRKKVKITKSLFSSGKNLTQPRAATSERKEEFSADYGNKTSRNTSPIKFRHAIVFKKPLLPAKNVPKSITGPANKNTTLLYPFGDTSSLNKAGNKKNSRHKKILNIKLSTPTGKLQ